MKKVDKLKINGEVIEPKNEMVYLGITLDSKLNWDPHIIKKN